MFLTKSVSIIIFCSSIIWCSFLSFGAYLNSSPTNDLFPFHPPFMAFGFLFCFTSGILSLANNHSKNTHIFFQILGTIFITIGFAIVVQAKNNVNEEHLKSSHSVIGVLSVICSWLQLISGIAKVNKSKKTFLKNHGGFGILTYVLGISALLIATTTYLCGNILKQNTLNICLNEETISMQYSVCMIVIASVSLMLYINKPPQKKISFADSIQNYHDLCS